LWTQPNAWDAGGKWLAANTLARSNIRWIFAAFHFTHATLPQTAKKKRH